MPTVDSEIIVNAPLDLVWNMAQEVEKFPEIMPDLDSVRILEREERTDVTTRVITEWDGRIAKFNRKVKWTEEDIWNSETHTCHFWQLLGDFNEYRGDWSFRDEQGNTAIKLHIDYRFEIPLVGAIMQKVVQNLLQENSDRMLKALKTESERRAQIIARIESLDGKNWS